MKIFLFFVFSVVRLFRRDFSSWHVGITGKNRMFCYLTSFFWYLEANGRNIFQGVVTVNLLKKKKNHQPTLIHPSSLATIDKGGGSNLQKIGQKSLFWEIIINTVYFLLRPVELTLVPLDMLNLNLTYYVIKQSTILCSQASLPKSTTDIMKNFASPKKICHWGWFDHTVPEADCPGVSGR